MPAPFSVTQVLASPHLINKDIYGLKMMPSSPFVVMIWASVTTRAILFTSNERQTLASCCSLSKKGRIFTEVKTQDSLTGQTQASDSFLYQILVQGLLSLSQTPHLSQGQFSNKTLLVSSEEERGSALCRGGCSFPSETLLPLNFHNLTVSLPSSISVPTTQTPFPAPLLLPFL